MSAAAPTACSATINGLDRFNSLATPFWKLANIRLLTVLLPAMKAPSAPITPAKAGQTLPTRSATWRAIVNGMLGSFCGESSDSTVRAIAAGGSASASISRTRTSSECLMLIESVSRSSVFAI